MTLPKNKPAVCGAVFDVDGTLLDSMPGWMHMAGGYLEDLGIHPDPDLDRQVFCMTVVEGVRFIREKYSLCQSEEEIMQSCLQRMDRFYRYEVKAKKGAEEFVRKLFREKIPMITATSGSRVLQEAALKRLGLLDLFTETLYCSELGINKNGPQVYLAAAEKMKTRPQQIIVFEDALHGIRSAKSAGFQVCAVKDDSDADDSIEICRISDLVVSDFREAAERIRFQSENQ